MKRLRVDIWGGDHSLDHVARWHAPLSPSDGWSARVAAELADGFLVNLRHLGPHEDWAPDEDFDSRALEGAEA